MNAKYITSWSLLGFDYECLLDKSKILGIYDEFKKLGSNEKVSNGFWIKDDIIKVDLIRFRNTKKKVGRLYDALPEYDIDKSMMETGSNTKDIKYNINVCKIQNIIFNKSNIVNELETLEYANSLRQDHIDIVKKVLLDYDMLNEVDDYTVIGIEI